MAKDLVIEVWSDIACPWCYVGKRRLEAALGQFPERAAVRVVWKAFELNPASPAVLPITESYAERLAKKYGTEVAQAGAMIKRMVDTAAADGLDFDFEQIRPGNTFNAHRLVHLGLERGKQDAVKERLLRAYLTEGEKIGDTATLQRLAVDAGLDEDEVAGVLAGDLFADAVRADQREARELGISGVPFFLIGRRYAVSGAQPAELLLGAITKTWQELAPSHESVPDGAVCGPDGCA